MGAATALIDRSRIRKRSVTDQSAMIARRERYLLHGAHNTCPPCTAAMWSGVLPYYIRIRPMTASNHTTSVLAVNVHDNEAGERNT